MSREQTVRDVAYAIWEAEGKPQGRDSDHWRLAEERIAASLTGGAKDTAKTGKTSAKSAVATKAPAAASAAKPPAKTVPAKAAPKAKPAGKAKA